MFKLKLYALALLVFCCKITIAQDSAVVIPFYLTAYNNLAIKAILNKKDTVNLMFHTAANFVTLTEGATQKITSINFNKTIDGVKSWGGAVNSSRISQNNLLQIGTMKWEGVEIAENKNSGQQTDGKFGIDLFKNKVIQIDFDKMIITITENLPNNLKKYQKLKLAVQGEMLFLEADCKIKDSVFTNKFLIHSGYSGAILFDDQFAAENKLSEKLKIIGEKELKDSYGNILKTKKAILPLLKIGNIKLLNTPVGFFEGAIGRQKVSIMGGDILKRFNIIIDAKRAYIYLKPNQLKKEKYASF